MRPKRVVVILGAAAVMAAASIAAVAKAVEGDRPACVGARSEARWGAYGYDHLVYVRNSCEKPADCTISTDVNPSPVRATIAPSREEIFVTFRGSPASAFQARVACTLQD